VRWPDRVWGVADQGPRFEPSRFEAYLGGISRRKVQESKRRNVEGKSQTVGELVDISTVPHFDSRRANVIEIVCHPGLPTFNDGPLSESFGKLRVESAWETELKSLLDSRWHEVISRHELQLSHYGQLNGPLITECR
jgi:hypothetical protein